MTTPGLNPPDAQTFASTLGNAVWLMTMSHAHRDLPVRDIEGRIALAILLRQFRLYSNGKQPVAFLTWASVTDEAKAKLDGGDRSLAKDDWRAGSNMVVVDVISPFADPAEIEKRFWDSVPKGSTPDLAH